MPSSEPTNTSSRELGLSSALHICALFFFDFDLLFPPPNAGAGAAFGDALYFFRNSTLKVGFPLCLLPTAVP